MRELERRVVLSVLDRKWREHLYEMDYLREGIGLRAMAQRDPLVEYQREGFDLFAAMMDGIKEESVGFVFNLEVEVEESPEQPAAVQPDASMPFAVAPEIHAKGLDEQHRRATAPVQRADVGRRRRCSGTARRCETTEERRVRGDAAQRSVSVRLREEVQEVPWRTGAPLSDPIGRQVRQDLVTLGSRREPRLVHVG